jgi:hypothetical protein
MERTSQADLGGELDTNDQHLPGSVTGKPPTTALTGWANYRWVLPVHTELQTVESVRDFGWPTGIRTHRFEQLNIPCLLAVHQVGNLHIPGIHEMNIGLQVTADQIGLNTLKYFIILLRGRRGRNLGDEPGVIDVAGCGEVRPIANPTGGSLGTRACFTVIRSTQPRALRRHFLHWTLLDTPLDLNILLLPYLTQELDGGALAHVGCRRRGVKPGQ